MKQFLDMPYAQASGRELLLDLYLHDRSDPAPVILWIPGGGWLNSSKVFDAAWLRQRGFAVAAMEYRLSTQAIAPANMHDCKAAVRWLRAKAGAYNLAADRIGAFGASAGGHLAALLGTSAGVAELEGQGGNPQQSSHVQAFCDFCGPTDLTRIAQPAIRQQCPVLYDVTRQYLGGPVEERTDLARLVSPLTYVTSRCPPALIVHGKLDPLVPVEESLVFYNALQRAGVDASLVVLPQAIHSWDWQLTNAQVCAFFERTLM